MKKLNEMLTGAIKDMKNAEREANVFKRMVEMKNEVEMQKQSIRNLSDNEQYTWFDKLALLEEVQDERVTNVNEMESIMKVIEIMKQLRETAKDEIHSYCWEPIYGRIEIESSIKHILMEQHIYVRDEGIFLNNLDDKYDSVESAFEKIRINLHDAHRERKEWLKQKSHAEKMKVLQKLKLDAMPDF
ncbi:MULTISPECIES: hypothetical protein [Bacillus]|uniref:hypothetical protein n=1 Tax=Bacillus TaxID=1386 RepID=UPI000BF69758|nr:hypothetical protein [Bacillus toyonensis]PGA38124.1 hypothetical protein COL81_17415 [Bacillus toyonensis]PGC09641.1 hypothetical protein COM20_01580 [Bacillus toyonensis]